MYYVIFDVTDSIVNRYCNNIDVELNNDNTQIQKVKLITQSVFVVHGIQVHGIFKFILNSIHDTLRSNARRCSMKILHFKIKILQKLLKRCKC